MSTDSPTDAADTTGAADRADKDANALADSTERVESALAATRADLADLAGRIAKVEHANATGAMAIGLRLPLDITLSADARQRIEEAVRVFGAATVEAASAAIFKAVKDELEPVLELLADLLTSETMRVLTGETAEVQPETAAQPEAMAQPETAGVVVPVAGLTTPTAAAPQVPAPTPQTLVTPEASIASLNGASYPAHPPDMDDTAFPLTLGSLDDPFLEALIRKEPLSPAL